MTKQKACIYYMAAWWQASYEIFFLFLSPIVAPAISQGPEFHKQTTKEQRPSWPTGREVMTTSSCWVRGYNSTIL